MIVISSCCGQALALPAAMTWISPSSCCCSGLFCCCCFFFVFFWNSLCKKKRKKKKQQWERKKKRKKAATTATSGDEGSNLLETPTWIDKFLTQIRAAADSSGELVVPFKPRRSLKKATLNGNNNFESLKIIDLLLKFRNISAIV